MQPINSKLISNDIFFVYNKPNKLNKVSADTHPIFSGVCVFVNVFKNINVSELVSFVRKRQ